MPGEVTQLLRQFGGADGSAVDRILPIVYRNLHALAAGYLRDERRAHTLQPTALVHEAYLRLVQQRSHQWQDRRHFFAIAAQAMRRVLVDHARSRNRVKRGCGRVRTLIDSGVGLQDHPAEDILAFDDALTRLAAVEPDAARVVELRCLAGLTADQTADALGVSPSTVARQWRLARAWLHCELSGSEAPQKDAEHDLRP